MASLKSEQGVEDFLAHLISSHVDLLRVYSKHEQSFVTISDLFEIFKSWTTNKKSSVTDDNWKAVFSCHLQKLLTETVKVTNFNIQHNGNTKHVKSILIEKGSDPSSWLKSKLSSQKCNCQLKAAASPALALEIVPNPWRSKGSLQLGEVMAINLKRKFSELTDQIIGRQDELDKKQKEIDEKQEELAALLEAEQTKLSDLHTLYWSRKSEIQKLEAEIRAQKKLMANRIADLEKREHDMKVERHLVESLKREIVARATSRKQYKSYHQSDEDEVMPKSDPDRCNKKPKHQPIIYKSCQ